MKRLYFIFLVALSACNSNQSKTLKDNEDSSTTTLRNIDKQMEYSKYCNDRYGYCIDYPNTLVYPQPESENGDGRVFKNRQGDEVLIVFGKTNATPEGFLTLQQQFDEDIHGVNEENGNNDRVITYQKLSNNFFVISGLKNGKIFYQKTILKSDGFGYAILQYDEKDKMMFDKISERVFRSFK